MLVNKRLAMARRLLTAGISVNDNALIQEAFIDAVLLQVYFALLHYMNELREHYRQDVLPTNDFSLMEIIMAGKQTISELTECQLLVANTKSWLSLVIRYPEAMLQGRVKIKNTQPSVSLLINVVPEDNEAEELLSIDVKTVDWVLRECIEFIQRQREHLMEY